MLPVAPVASAAPQHVAAAGDTTLVVEALRCCCCCCRLRVVTRDGAALYIDPAKVTPAAAAELADAGAEVKPYGQLLDDVRGLAATGVKLWMDPARVSYALKQAALAAGGVDTEGGSAAGRKRPRAEAGGGADAEAAMAANGSEAGGEQAPTASDVVLEKTSPVVLAKVLARGPQQHQLCCIQPRCRVQQCPWSEPLPACGPALPRRQLVGLGGRSRAPEFAHVQQGCQLSGHGRRQTVDSWPWLAADR